MRSPHRHRQDRLLNTRYKKLVLYDSTQSPPRYNYFYKPAQRSSCSNQRNVLNIEELLHARRPALVLNFEQPCPRVLEQERPEGVLCMGPPASPIPARRIAFSIARHLRLAFFSANARPTRRRHNVAVLITCINHSLPKASRENPLYYIHLWLPQRQVLWMLELRGFPSPNIFHHTRT
ncbi:unnamed protein product [Nesidiocoris tenuis]|uniref:Uncharacterized protein n=1 Tax=Nesidiocoris tenuis TaxID=355587 RepID=A0A6H5H8P3_9HEMI|nr:unnamed protein product [Nesidiocoris tenuis]